MPTLAADAVVIGGGHHGLVAAAVLADAGWDVCVLESTDVRSAAQSAPPSCTPVSPPTCSARSTRCRPASPVLRALELDQHGLRWAHAPSVLAHPPRPDGDPAAVLHRDREQTAAGLAAHDPRRRGGLAAAVRAVGPDRGAGAAHPVHRIPAGARPGPAAAPGGHRGRAATGPVPAASGQPDGRGAVRVRSRPAAAGRQRRARRRPAGRAGQRRLRLAAGHARPAVRVPGRRSAAAGSWPRRWVGGPPRPGRRSAPGSTWSGSRCAAVGRSPCTPRPGSPCAPAGP